MKNFSDLAVHAGNPFPMGYPVDEHITLYAPDDNLAGALAFFIDAAEHSLSLALPHLDQEALAMAVLRKLEDPKVFVQLCLPAYTTCHPRLSAAFKQPACHVVLTDAEIPGWTGSVDGLDAFTGDGCVFTFTRQPIVAATARHRIDLLMASRGE